MESCNVVKILSLALSCQLPIFQSHQLDLLLISCTFVECATPCNFSSLKRAGSRATQDLTTPGI